MYLLERIFALRALIAAAMAGDCAARSAGGEDVSARWSWTSSEPQALVLRWAVDPFLARRGQPCGRPRPLFGACHVRMSAWLFDDY